MSNSPGQPGFYTTGVSNAAPRAVRASRRSVLQRVLHPRYPSGPAAGRPAAGVRGSYGRADLGHACSPARSYPQRSLVGQRQRCSYPLARGPAQARDATAAHARTRKAYRPQEISIYARLSKTSKYRDDTFPRPVSLAPNSGPTCRRKAAIAFSEDEVEIWLAARLNERTTD